MRLRNLREERTTARLEASDGDIISVTKKRKKRKARSVSKSLVYGVFLFQAGEKDGMIVFFEKPEALALTKVWSAVRSAKTWREFRERTPRKEYASFMCDFDYRGESRPKGTQPFDKTDLWLTSEDWCPLDSMVDFLPESVISLGQRADTPGMGDWVSFEPSQEAEVVRTLRADGWRVVRDDALVRRAGGDWIDGNFA